MIRAFTAFCLLALAAAAPCLAAEPLTLARAYAQALEHSDALRAGEAEWRAAEARYRTAVGARWPELRAEGSAEFRDPGDSSQPSEEYSAGLGASWTLFNGFRAFREAAARKAEGEAAGLDVARFRQLLYEDVADAFYQVLGLEGALAAAADESAALDQRAAELERRVALGRSRPAELLSARAQVADARVTREQLKGLREASTELLSFLVGKPAEDVAPVEAGALPDARDVERVLAAQELRPDVAAAGKRVEAAQLEAKAVLGDRNATVSLDGNLYVWRNPDDAGDWDLVLKVELPLFDGGIRRGRVVEKEELARAREFRLAELRRIADRDVRLAAKNLESALAQWAALQDALRATEESYETQRKDYEIGRASNLDVMASLARLHELRRRSASLEMGVRAALVRLQVAAGAGSP